MHWQERTELLIGADDLNKLSKSHVLVCGLGGVGGAAAEMLVRAGVGELTIVDGDVIHRTNRNRQLIALFSNEEMKKAEEWGRRLKDINPMLKLRIIVEFIRDERMIEILDGGFDYVVDAIDTLSPKVFLIFHAVNKGLRIVSSMGAGGKLDPQQVKVDDISLSNTCKLALNIRKRLHKLGIFEGVKVVYSTEKVAKECIRLVEGETNKKSTVGTISYMPNIFGCFCASVVVRDLINSSQIVK
jgi:tRNA threonylcarbamoyladenosine dehydratase